MELDRLFGPSGPDVFEPLAERFRQPEVMLPVGLELAALGLCVTLENAHGVDTLTFAKA
jgi:hypothetical protein